MKDAIYETYFISSKLKLTNVNANLEKNKLREQILKASNQVKEFLNTCLLRKILPLKGHTYLNKLTAASCRFV